MRYQFFAMPVCLLSMCAVLSLAACSEEAAKATNTGKPMTMLKGAGAPPAPMVAPLKGNTIEVSAVKGTQTGQVTEKITFTLSRAADNFLVVDYHYEPQHPLAGIRMDESFSVWLCGDGQNVHLYQFAPVAGGELSWGHVRAEAQPDGATPLDAATAIGTTALSGSIRSLMGRAALKLPSFSSSIALGIVYWSGPIQGAQVQKIAVHPAPLNWVTPTPSEFQPFDHAALPEASAPLPPELLEQTRARSTVLKAIYDSRQGWHEELRALAERGDKQAFEELMDSKRVQLRSVILDAIKGRTDLPGMAARAAMMAKAGDVDAGQLLALLKANPWLLGDCGNAFVETFIESRQQDKLVLWLEGVATLMGSGGPDYAPIAFGFLVNTYIHVLSVLERTSPAVQAVINALRPLEARCPREERVIFHALLAAHVFGQDSAPAEKEADAVIEAMTRMAADLGQGNAASASEAVSECFGMFRQLVQRRFYSALTIFTHLQPHAVKAGWMKPLHRLGGLAVQMLAYQEQKFDEALALARRIDAIPGIEPESVSEWAIVVGRIEAIAAADPLPAMRKTFTELKFAAPGNDDQLETVAREFVQQARNMKGRPEGWERTYQKAAATVFGEFGLHAEAVNARLRAAHLAIDAGDTKDALGLLNAINAALDSPDTIKGLNPGHVEQLRNLVATAQWDANLLTPAVPQEQLDAALKDETTRNKRAESFRYVPRGTFAGEPGLYVKLVTRGRDADAKVALGRIDAALKANKDSLARMKLQLARADLYAGIGVAPEAEHALREAEALRSEIPAEKLAGLPDLRIFDTVPAQLSARRQEFDKAVADLDLRLKREPAPVWASELKRMRDDYEKAGKELGEEARLWAAEPKDLPRVLLTTTAGEIECVLFEDDAPENVANFIHLVENGFYVNKQTGFHRLEPHFVVQGGDPNGDGTGGPGWAIKLEAKRKHWRGSLAMAKSSEPDSAGSSFYFVLEDGSSSRALDDPNNGGYTVFGRITRGLDVMDKLRIGHKITGAKVLSKRGHEYTFTKLKEVR